MKTYLVLKPTDFFVHYELAKLLLQEGDKESALLHLKRVEKIKKDYKDTESLIKNIEGSSNKN